MDEWYGSAAIARVAELPYVKRAVSAAAPLVPSKESQIVERLNQLCASHAKPFLKRHADTLKEWDKYACQQLDAIETAASSLQDRFSTVHSTVHSKAATVERTLLAPSRMILDRADAFLDAMLPEDDAGKAHDARATGAKTPEHAPSYADAVKHPGGAGTEAAPATGEAARGPTREDTLGAETREVIKHTRDFSHRLQIRAYARALRQMETAKSKGSKLLHAAEPYSKPVVEYSQKLTRRFRRRTSTTTPATSAKQQGKEGQEDVTASMSEMPSRVYSRVHDLVRQLTAANLERLQFILRHVDHLRARVVQTASSFRSVISSKAGDLVCSAKQTEAYNTVVNQLEALKQNERIIRLSEALVHYLETLGITLPDAVLSMLPLHHNQEQESAAEAAGTETLTEGEGMGGSGNGGEQADQPPRSPSPLPASSPSSPSEDEQGYEKEEQEAVE